MDRPILSIIIPVYNASEYIGKIVENILSQNFKEFELLLINDGSSDNSLKIINNFAKKDSRIVVYSQKNGGPSSARNLGLKNARGKYIQFYDADDSIEPKAIELVINKITSSKTDLLVSGWQIIQQKSKRSLSIHPNSYIITDNLTIFILNSIGQDGTLYNLWNKLFRADIIRKHNLRFREDLQFGEDLLFSLEYFSHIKSIQLIPDTTYQYLVNSTSSVFSKSSIIPEYRLMNDSSLIEFANKNSNKDTLPLLTWVRWRWVLSYWMLLQKSKLSSNEKKRRLTDGFPKNLNTKNMSYSVNGNKVIIAKIAELLKSRPALALLFAKLLNLTKDFVKWFKINIHRK